MFTKLFGWMYYMYLGIIFGAFDLANLRLTSFIDFDLEIVVVRQQYKYIYICICLDLIQLLLLCICVFFSVLRIIPWYIRIIRTAGTCELIAGIAWENVWRANEKQRSRTLFISPENFSNNMFVGISFHIVILFFLFHSIYSITSLKNLKFDKSSFMFIGCLRFKYFNLIVLCQRNNRINLFLNISNKRTYSQYHLTQHWLNIQWDRFNRHFAIAVTVLRILFSQHFFLSYFELLF